MLLAHLVEHDGPNLKVMSDQRQLNKVVLFILTHQTLAHDQCAGFRLTTRSCIIGMQTTFTYASSISKSMLLSCRLSCHGGGTDCVHSSLEVFGSLIIPVVPLLDSASCSKYTVYQKSMQLAPPCARIRELQSCRTSMWSLFQEVARMHITCTSYKWAMTVMSSISEM